MGNGPYLSLNDTLDEITAGRTESFGRIVREFSLPLRSYLASQVHHLDDVDDLAQDTFVAMFRGLNSYRRGDDFGAWLRGIARNKLLNHYRSTSRRNLAMQRFREEVAVVVEKDLERAAETDTAESIEQLLRCVSQLPDRLRQVVRACLDGNKPAELAKNLSTSIGAIYNLHYRANQLLRECLQKGHA